MTEASPPAATQPCPRCGATGLPIRYGEVDPASFPWGKAVPGGCIILTGQSPAWACTACDERWGIYEDDSLGWG